MVKRGTCDADDRGGRIIRRAACRFRRGKRRASVLCIAVTDVLGRRDVRAYHGYAGFGLRMVHRNVKKRVVGTR